MTVAELIAKLQEMPQDAMVAVPDWESGGFLQVEDVGLSWAYRSPRWSSTFWEKRDDGDLPGSAQVVAILDRVGDPL
jgi:hypothetical protein